VFKNKQITNNNIDDAKKESWPAHTEQQYET
jgi:hypothetical protein